MISKHGTISELQLQFILVRFSQKNNQLSYEFVFMLKNWDWRVESSIFKQFYHNQKNQSLYRHFFLKKITIKVMKISI